MTDAIRIEGVRVRYDEHAGDVLNIEALSIPYGQRVAFIGTSGAGKTTLLRLINGLITPVAGRIELWGVNLGSAEAPA